MEQTCERCDGAGQVKSWLSKEWEAKGMGPVYIDCPVCNPPEPEEE